MGYRLGKTRKVPPVIDTEKRAVAYYRQASKSKRDDSITGQQEQVRTWAAENGLTIIKEFCDRGKSGASAEGRPAFLNLLQNWVKKRQDFKYIICFDISRWGRFSDMDLSAKYRNLCKCHNKEIVYVTAGAYDNIPDLIRLFKKNVSLYKSGNRLK